MTHLTRILCFALMLFSLTSCFKKETQGTLFKIAVYSQNTSDDTVTKTTSDMAIYAFHVPEGSKWEVKSWEDALNCCITNTDRPSEQLTTPNVIGKYDPSAEYQVEIGLWAEHVFMVIVDLENRVFATRFHDTPMNLPVTYTQLHLYAWRPSGSANGWTTTNPFPDEERTPINPSVDNDKTEE